MAYKLLVSGKLPPLQFPDLLDKLAPEIMLKGLGRPWQLMAAHGAVISANYLGFFAFVRRDLVKILTGRCSDTGDEAKERRARKALAALLFAKFLVWQHLAEALGCRQGPLGGYFGLPNNWKYRLSLGTIKHPLVPIFGKRRNILDFVVHVLFFLLGGAFLASKDYETKYLKAICACDVWICFSDLSQFFASTGHAYFAMLLSMCFPERQGRLAGIQTGLIIQWFFSGIGKLGPWFGYVNAPFMLQSRLLAGQGWLFRLLVKSPSDLSPTLMGKIVAHTAAAVEYLAPLALMFPIQMKPLPAIKDAEKGEEEEGELVPLDNNWNKVAKASRWFGVAGLAAMHTYILTMPAPFDVYSWNLCFGLSSLYLFIMASFGFDQVGARGMHKGLAAYLVAETALCWYGQFFPDQVGYYFSHRYWAGNWVQTFFYVKKSAVQKLAKVKTCSSAPQIWRALEPMGGPSGAVNFAYLWLANLNMKAALGLIAEGARLAGGVTSDFFPMGLTQFCAGEFRDALYALPLLPTMQEQIGFEKGECFMVRLGAFGMFQDKATWGIYDLKEGLLKSGFLRQADLFKMDSLPTQSLAPSSLKALMAA